MSRWRQLGNGPNELIAFGLGHNEGELHLKANAAARPLFPCPPARPLIPTFPALLSPPLPRQQPISPSSPFLHHFMEKPGSVESSACRLPSLRGSLKISHPGLWKLSRESLRPHLPLGGSRLSVCRRLGSQALSRLEAGAVEPCGSGGGHTCLSEPLRGRGCCGGRLRLQSTGSERGGIEQTRGHTHR